MRKYIPAYIRVPFIFILILGFIEYFVDSGDTFAFIKYPVILAFLFVVLIVIIAIEIIMNATDNILYQIMSPEEKKKVDEANAIPITETDWYKNIKLRITKTQPLENEPQLLLDHDFDGIKELDNVLPPWWVYLFYGCILFSAIYLIRYHILGAPNQEMELKNEMAQAKIEVAEYMKTAPDLMDEKTVTQLTDKAALSTGKTIFTTNCVACHRADAGGAIGPNLTDDHWILGGGIKNIFHTINNGGRDGKGMISWKATLKPKEMQKVASYIMSLKGSNPKDPKAPDGDIWIDTNLIKKDSTTIKK
jgi:cytochrome c oxidase cbb3-type subunit III